MCDGYQLHFIYDNDEICDVVCHKYSCGHEENLLEIRADLFPSLVDSEVVGDTVEGNLTAEEVFDRIKKFVEENAK